MTVSLGACPLSRSLHRLHEDDGISLVETLVSILLLALVFSALAATLLSSMAAARQNEGLTIATSIANERIEQFHTLTWAALVPGAPVTDPTPVVRGNRSYTVTSQVEWLDAPTNRYKGFWVELAWTENGEAHDIRLDARRSVAATGGTGTSVGSDTFRILLFTVNPDPVNLSSAGLTMASTSPTLDGGAAMIIEVMTSHPAACGSVVASWPQPSPTQTLTLQKADGTACTADGATEWQVLVPSGQAYPSGWMNFSATAVKADDPAVTATSQTVAWLMAPITFVGMAYDTTGVRSYSLTAQPPSTVNRLCTRSELAESRLRNDNPFYVDLRGLTINDSVVLRRTDVAGVQFPMTYSNYGAPYGWRWSVTVPGYLTSNAAGTFTPHTYSNWELRWTRSYDGLSDGIPLRFYILIAGGNSPCENAS